jgi:hypothetical protein
MGGCAPAPSGDGIDVVEEMLAVGRWSTVGVEATGSDICEGCLLAYTLDYWQDDDGLVHDTESAWVHHPGSSGLAAGALLCEDHFEERPIDFGDDNPDPDLRWLREHTPIEKTCPVNVTLGRVLIGSEIAARAADGSPTVASWWPVVNAPNEPSPRWKHQPALGFRFPASPIEPCAVERQLPGRDYCVRDCRMDRDGDEGCDLPESTGPL